MSPMGGLGPALFLNLVVAQGLWCLLFLVVGVGQSIAYCLAWSVAWAKTISLFLGWASRLLRQLLGLQFCSHVTQDKAKSLKITTGVRNERSFLLWLLQMMFLDSSVCLVRSEEVLLALLVVVWAR
jgi:hypothetical protein